MRFWISLSLFIIVYVGSALFGLSLAFANSSISAVWPPTGIAIAALLIYGKKLWPGVLLGAFIANMLTTTNVYTSAAIAVGNTLEAVIGEILIRRVVSEGYPFITTDTIFSFVLIELCIATPIAALIGVASLFIAQLVSLADVPLSIITWWLGDACGAFVIGIPLLVWMYHPYKQLYRPQESIAVFGSTVITGMILFTDLSFIGTNSYPASYMAIPVLIWAAFRLDQFSTTIIVLILQAFALIGTLAGNGPFAVIRPTESLLFLQVFISICSIGTLAVNMAIRQLHDLNKILSELVTSGTSRLSTEQTRFESIFNVADDAIIITDQSGIIELFNKSAERIFGYTQHEIIGQTIDTLLPDRFIEIHHKHMKAFAQSSVIAKRMGERKDIFGKHKDTVEFPAEASISKFTDTNNDLKFCVILHDITVRKEIEARLRISLHEKEILLQEIHHRVKNNLQIIMSLLRLQAATVHDSRFIDLLRDSQNRVQAMAMVHEHLYKSLGLSQINCKAYIQDLVTSILRSYGTKHVTSNINIDPSLTVAADTAIPLGLIIVELVSNSLKYAFPESNTCVVQVQFTRIEQTLLMSVSDNGIGIPETIDKKSSLGIQLIHDLTHQLHGSIEIDRSSGTAFHFVFPISVQ